MKTKTRWIGCCFIPALACNSMDPTNMGGDAPADTVFATFTDAPSGFATVQVHDVDETVILFDRNANTLIFEDQVFEGWNVSGNFLDSRQQFQVRFGSRSGEMRAYFTETGPATICDLLVEDGALRIFPTPETVN